MSEVDDFPALEAALRDAWERQRLFAGAISLIRHGRVAGVATAGVDITTRFEIGSITKMLTAVAILKSARVDLDAPVTELVSAFRFDDPRGRTVTTRHLLTHSSGLPSAGRDFGPHDPGALRRFATTDLARHRFHAVPGTVANYSSTAISLAGLILEEAFGAPFPDVMRRLVLIPSEMSSTAFPDAVDPKTVSWPHRRSADGWRPVDRLADNPAGYPSGFLLSSIEDMTLFALYVIDGTLLSEGSVALAASTCPRWTDHAPSPLARVSSNYGLGAFTGEWGGQAVIRHGGSQLTSNCSIDFFPESDSAVVLLTNGADDDTFMRLLDLCYRAIAGPPMTSPGPSPIDRRPVSIEHLSGTFLNADSGAIAVVETDQGTPTMVRDGHRMPLRSLGSDRWLADSPSGQVPVGIPTADERTDHVFVWGDLYQRIDGDKARPHPDPLTGTYVDSFWDDPETRIRVEKAGDVITVTSGRHVAPGCWLGPGLVSDHGLIEFEPDGSSLRLGRATTYRRVD